MTYLNVHPRKDGEIYLEREGEMRERRMTLPPRFKGKKKGLPAEREGLRTGDESRARG